MRKKGLNAYYTNGKTANRPLYKAFTATEGKIQSVAEKSFSNIGGGGSSSGGGSYSVKDFIKDSEKSEVMNQNRQSEMIVCSFFCLGGMIRMKEGVCVMLSGEFLSLFWKYLQFNTEGDITGISEDAPDEAKKAFRHYMKLMQDPHRNV